MDFGNLRMDMEEPFLGRHYRLLFMPVVEPHTMYHTPVTTTAPPVGLAADAYAEVEVLSMGTEQSGVHEQPSKIDEGWTDHAMRFSLGETSIWIGLSASPVRHTEAGDV